jgi:hypothetical protein
LVGGGFKESMGLGLFIVKAGEESGKINRGRKRMLSAAGEVGFEDLEVAALCLCGIHIGAANFKDRHG